MDGPPSRESAERDGVGIEGCGTAKQPMTTSATSELGSLSSIEALIRARRLADAEAALAREPETDENRNDLAFLRGYLAEARYERGDAIAAYEHVLEQDPDHVGAAFRAGLFADQYGDDDAAVSFYELCTDRDAAPVNGLINLAVLYEEHGDLRRAERCLGDVLAEYPNHPRARRFLKSVLASYAMVFDERTQREHEQHSAVLDMPISDFELSVRSRNCLRQMNIRTLGDLLATTEAELLSYKNFGETSLSEITVMLDNKGLSLGQSLQPPIAPAVPTVPTVPPDASGLLGRPIAELELSMRSRKALQRLGVTTIGELAARTESELMTIKNFGETSLVEIKGQLEKVGLSFRQLTAGGLT